MIGARPISSTKRLFPFASERGDLRLGCKHRAFNFVIAIIINYHWKQSMYRRLLPIVCLANVVWWDPNVVW